MGRPNPGPTLHERIERALDRAARAHEESHTLIDECRQASLALYDTVTAGHKRKQRSGRAGPAPVDCSETDNRMP